MLLLSLTTLALLKAGAVPSSKAPLSAALGRHALGTLALAAGAPALAFDRPQYAIVGDYQKLPGFYPRVAGLIASHGPYRSVADVFQIPGLTDGDRKLIKNEQDKLTVLPPGRGFVERINQRQSA
ncbi:photosystem II 12 kDa extrinsic protein-domain-containing protein [Pavlovales sp. CCMP2436]|nr:photosystem II 12 kDa extrinsic protein-domain-containing protein [Pavlovales sp. CCMP2436]